MVGQTLGGIFVAVLIVTGLAPVAAASGLLDSSLSWQYYAGGQAYNSTDPTAVTFGTFVDGVGGTFAEPGPNDFFSIYDTETTITFDYSSYYSTDGLWIQSPLSLPPTIYNGIAIDLLSTGTFATVTIDAATNMAGFDASDLSFTGNEIQVNWAGLSFDTSTVLTLDVTMLPEPRTWSLVDLPLLVTCLIARRRRRTQ